MCLKGEYGEDLVRRDFLIGSAATAAVAAAVGTGLNAQEPAAPTRVLDNAAVLHGPVSIAHNGETLLDGYLARPNRPGRFRGVIVIAGNRITEEYIPNTCAALALAGFVGLAPNLYHIVPDSAKTNEEIAAAAAKHDDDDVLLDMMAGLNHLRRQEFVDSGSFGVLGYCYGGKMGLKLANRCREIDAALIFHPAQGLTSADVSRLRIPVQIHSGLADRAAPPDTVRSLTKLLKSQGTPTETFFYEGADHGFLAYTRPQRYNPAAAQLAWQRAAAFLRRRLK